MKTLTVEDVIEAYRVTGLKPKRYHARIIDGCCCGIGAKFIADGNQPIDNSDAILAWFYREYGPDEAFTDGFDGITIFSKHTDHPLYRVGREAAIRLGLIKEQA